VRTRVRKRLARGIVAGLAAVALAAVAVHRWSGGGAPEELGPCELGPTIRGIDVSYHQDDVSWKQVRRAGVQFAFIRVSDGVTVSDPKFADNWKGARRAGVLRGVYQYFRPEESAIAQADLLIAAVRRDPGELPPVIDVETDGGKSPEQLAARVRAWVERVRSQLAVEPIVYTGPDFWRQRVASADLTSQPLWLAHYTEDAACPTVPLPWLRWTFWQHTDRGNIPGIARPVDLNVFAGDYLALEEFARRSRVGAKPAVPGEPIEPALPADPTLPAVPVLPAARISSK
jgi:lysozyme